MKRILFYEPPGFTSKKKFGGSMMSLLQLVEKLDKSNYRPLIVLCHEYDQIDEFLKNGCDVIKLSEKSVSHAVRKDRRPQLLRHFKCVPFKHLVHDFIGIYKKLGILTGLIKIIRDNKIDIVHCNSKYEWSVECILSAQIFKIPCICHSRSYTKTHSILFGLIEKMVNRHIAISMSIRDNLVENRVDPGKISIVHNWINADSIVNRDLPSHYYPPAPFKVLSVGRIVRWKGVDILIEAIRRIIKSGKMVQLDIYGEIPEGEEYIQELNGIITSNRLNNYINFMGYASTKEIYHCNYDLFVHSATSPEPFGRVIIEAMYNYVPVIASRIGGVTDIIQDGKNGLMFDPGSADSLASKIEMLISRETYRNAIAMNGRISVMEKFTDKGKIETICGIYDDLAKCSNTRTLK